MVGSVNAEITNGMVWGLHNTNNPRMLTFTALERVIAIIARTNGRNSA